jgi:hypothetical protein
MSRKPRLLLLDAGAVFAALAHDCWEVLVSSYEVVIGAVVVRDEAMFYTTRDGERIEIDLPAEVARGRIREIDMSAEEVNAVRKRFTPDFHQRLDDGELEAIAWLLKNADQDLRFVSGDGPAIQAVAMLDEDRRAISLEEALQYCGLTKHLSHQFQREFTHQNLEQGNVSRIQGWGLSNS